MKSSELDIYCVAIGGTGMAPLACLLKEQGHRVRGSDNPLYPPMSTLLEAAGIEPLVGYDAAHLEQHPQPDLIVVGNAVPRTNPEARAVESLELPRLSMPQALARFFLADRQPLVVSGAHGKTTTTSMAAWVYARAGADPGYFIGGVPRNLDRSFQIGSGPRFIIEGDEYNASYFDRGPKFLHYRPQALILTSVEYDHADLYPDHETLIEAYRSLVRLVPAEGLLVACGDSPDVRDVAAAANCRTVFYGLEPGNDVHPISTVDMGPSGSSWKVAHPEAGELELQLKVPGDHNVSNALAVWAVACHDGLDPRVVREALAEFEGSQRRLEALGEGDGVVVIDDFAHHPTAIEKSLSGLRRAYPGRRLIALFEPRSLTAGRSFLFAAYRQAFANADWVLIAPIFHRNRLAPSELLDVDRLIAELQQSGIEAATFRDTDEILADLLRRTHAGDIVVTMSSGSFDGLPHRLLRGLTDREACA